MDPKAFLMELSNAVGVSGYEDARAKIAGERLAPLCDEVRRDALGNVICLKKGGGKGKIMLCAHMDEIGLMVADIGEKGFLRVATVGGFDPRTLIAQEVIIHGREELFGVIGAMPPHLTSKDDAKKAAKITDLLVDTGLRAEELRGLVRPGDLITVKRQAKELLNNKIMGKCLDDCAAVAVYPYILENLRDFRHDYDIYLVVSVQEEVGSRGAITAAYGIDPDIGIAIDVGHAKTPELDGDSYSDMGGGPEIARGPAIHPRVFEALRGAAKQRGTKFQIGLCAHGTATDTDEIQVSRSGVAAGLLSIPCKYMHTSVEVVSMDDIEAAARVISDFIISLNNRDLEEFLCL